jgi:hypothetical protein
VLGRAAATTAAAAVAAFAVLSNAPAPAFAVDRHPDGSVTVTIHRLSDSAGLERKLNAAGSRAVVNYTPAGMTCREPRGAHPAAPLGSASAAVSGVRSAAGSSTTFRITRSMVTPGQTLVITTSGANTTGPTSIGIQVVQGAVSPCTVVRAPSVPPPGGAPDTGGAVSSAP